MGAMTLKTDSLEIFVKAVLERWQKPGHPPEVTALFPKGKIIGPRWARSGKRSTASWIAGGEDVKRLTGRLIVTPGGGSGNPIVAAALPPEGWSCNNATNRTKPAAVCQARGREN